jgi:hypothetical protein
VSFAPANTLPLESRTTPVTDAVESWAKEGTAKKLSNAQAAKKLKDRRCENSSLDDGRNIPDSLK